MEDAKEARALALSAVQKYLQGSETVLVAEDDRFVLIFVKMMLEEYGYGVVEAVNGKDALARFRENKDRVALVLCDIIMPGMSGADVQKQIAKESPKTAFLFMSGYPDYTRMKNLLKEGSQILPKPFSPTVLLRKVRESLDLAGRKK